MEEDFIGLALLGEQAQKKKWREKLWERETGFCY